MTVTRANQNALLGFFAAFGAGGLASLLCRYALQYSAKKAKPVRVLITGAAGQIGYALAPMIAAGGLLGPGQPVILHLLDIEPARVALEGVRMELVDGAFPLLQGVVASTDVEVAAKDVDVAIMVGGHPRRQGEERKDVMARNVTIYKSQAAALDAHASKDVKVVVVANPANTNAFILKENAPGIPEQNITCLTRLDHNRASGQVAERLGVHVSEVQNVIIWGNHSSTQYPDVAHGTVAGVPIRTAIADPAWLDGEFITTVQQRGASIIRARGLSSALSAAVAVCGHVHDWMVGTPPKQWVSMGVVSDGSYGITPGLVYSFPVTASKGKWRIVTGLEILPPARQKLRATEDELEEERKLAAECLDAEQKASTST